MKIFIKKTHHFANPLQSIRQTSIYGIKPLKRRSDCRAISAVNFHLVWLVKLWLVIILC